MTTNGDYTLPCIHTFMVIDENNVSEIGNYLIDRFGFSDSDISGLNVVDRIVNMTNSELDLLRRNNQDIVVDAYTKSMDNAQLLDLGLNGFSVLRGEEFIEFKKKWLEDKKSLEGLSDEGLILKERENNFRSSYRARAYFVLSHRDGADSLRKNYKGYALEDAA